VKTKVRRPVRDHRREESEEDLITRIAWMYYKEKLTQQQIAESISLSRQKVQRMLERARDLEIIQFTLKHPVVNLLAMETAIRQKYSLKDAVVAPSGDREREHLRTTLALAGAAYLERRLAAMPKCTLGIGWGNTTAALADCFDGQSVTGKIEIVSLLGNLMLNVSMNPYIMADKMARKLDATLFDIWAPVIAQTKERAEVFKSEPWIKEVLDIGRRADVILLSIGEAARSASLFKMGYLSAADLQRLIVKGAVGDVLCRYLDAGGEMIDDEVQERVIGIPVEVMRDPSKLVIGVAGGSSKVSAIHAALLKKYVNVLITDEKTGAALLRR
jgi:lsr operon transcriptional repressor